MKPFVVANLKKPDHLAALLVPQPITYGLIKVPFSRTLAVVEVASIGARDKEWRCKLSEDRHVTTPTMVAVIDGATSVNPDDRYGAFNPAEFSAEFLAHYVRKYSHRNESAEQTLIRANAAKRRVLQRHNNSDQLDFVSGPSAAASLVKFHDNATFDVATASDTVVCARTCQGSWVQLTKDLLAPARKQMEQAVNAHEAGITAEEQELRLKKLKDPRFRRAFLYNKGTAVFNGDPLFETSQLIQVTGPLETIAFSHIVIMSDGAYPNGDPLATCKRLENRSEKKFCPHVVAKEIFEEKALRRTTDLGGKAFDDLTIAVITIPQAELQ